MWSSCAWVMMMPTRSFFTFSMKPTSGMMRSTPGRSSPANATPRSTISHLRALRRTVAVERAIHADFAQGPRGPRTRIRCRLSFRFGLPARAKRTKPPRASHPIEAISRGPRLRSSRSRSLRETANGRQRSSPSNVPSRRPPPLSIRTRSPSAGRAIEPEPNESPRTRRPPAMRRALRQSGSLSRSKSACASIAPPLSVGQNGRRIADALRRAHAIDADADDAGEALLGKRRALDQKAGAFRAAGDEIVRPFEARRPRRASSAARASATPATKPSCARHRLRTRVDQQSAGVEIAPRRSPGPTAPAPPGALLIGDDPETSGIAGERAPARLLVGRVRSRRGGRRATRERRSAPAASQNRVCAAAIAALVSGEGANTNTMISSAAIASTPRATTPGRSNALAGSSKYISLTMRR